MKWYYQSANRRGFPYIYGLSTAPRRVGGSSVACRRLLRNDRQHAFMNILVQPGTSRLIKKFFWMDTSIDFAA